MLDEEEEKGDAKTSVEKVTSVKNAKKRIDEKETFTKH